MAKDPRQMSPLRRHLSPLTQFLSVAILALFVGVAILAWPVIGKNVADPAGRAQPAPSEEARGTFKPTKEQWAGFKIEPVGLVSFRPEQVTEGSIAIDDDLTTPVFSQHSVYEGDTARVRVAEEDGTIAGRSVRIGQIADGMVEILEGGHKARRT
jgi:cobalt-zinc-cadmium efflux system membrane fusion protein